MKKIFKDKEKALKNIHAYAVEDDYEDYFDYKMGEKH